ncbi:hypothetical protein AWZ03_014729 [Drosophila navojoa]|uniref:Uncharacterized protein n=1 Tax=Drosophila navojoa TaxID=7232 RepID=A0A484ASK2_DRONA|nr:hypothetical protein AWZ03_014729 [Drosophila navojoa]
MYRQIELDESHRNFKLIVWKETPMIRLLADVALRGGYIATMSSISSVLHTLHTHDNTTDMESLAAERGTEFVFIPLGEPHFDGLWEAAGKSVRLILKAVGCTVLRLDDLANAVDEVEAEAVNGRY